MKDKVKEQAKVWGPRIAFFAVFGFTGIVAVSIYRAVKAVKDSDFDISWDQWTNGQQ